MGAILGWCVAGMLALCTWWVWRRFARDWRHLEQLIDELAAGRKPGGFGLNDNLRLDEIRENIQFSVLRDVDAVPQKDACEDNYDPAKLQRKMDEALEH